MWFKPAIRDSVQPPPGQRMQILQSGFNVHNHHFFRWYREIEMAGGLTSAPLIPVAEMYHEAKGKNALPSHAQAGPVRDGRTERTNVIYIYSGNRIWWESGWPGNDDPAFRSGD
jgi:hypothetical protein